MLADRSGCHPVFQCSCWFACIARLYQQFSTVYHVHGTVLVGQRRHLLPSLQIFKIIDDGKCGPSSYRICWNIVCNKPDFQLACSCKRSWNNWLRSTIPKTVYCPWVHNLTCDAVAHHFVIRVTSHLLPAEPFLLPVSPLPSIQPPNRRD